ncbi:Tripartite tricarboxylate transporter family receptor [compost metagenome]
MDQWHGLLAPAATPRAVVDKLNAAVTKIVRRPEMQAALREQGFTPASSTPKEFQSMINADIDRYTALTESIGLRAD